MAQDTLVILRGHCGHCGGEIVARLGSDADHCGCGGALLDVVRGGGGRYRQSGPVLDLVFFYGRPMAEAPRDGTPIHVWTTPWYGEVKAACCDGDWQTVGEADVQYLAESSLVTWLPVESEADAQDSETTGMDKAARRMLDAGHPRERAIADVINTTEIDRMKAAGRVRLGNGARLFEASAADAGALWLRAEVVAAIRQAITFPVRRVGKDRIAAEVAHAFMLAAALEPTSGTDGPPARAFDAAARLLAHASHPEIGGLIDAILAATSPPAALDQVRTMIGGEAVTAVLRRCGIVRLWSGGPLLRETAGMDSSLVFVADFADAAAQPDRLADARRELMQVFEEPVGLATWSMLPPDAIERVRGEVVVVFDDRQGVREASPAAGDDNPWPRGHLANARRIWLHYDALGGRLISGEQVARDLGPIIAGFEAACDEIDRLGRRTER